MEDNIVDGLRSCRDSVEEFKSFKHSIEELRSQINILSEESKFNLKLIDDEIGSYQYLQQENENLKSKLELSQKRIQFVETEFTELKNKDSNLKRDFDSQKIQIAIQIEQIKRFESDNELLRKQIQENSFAQVNDLTNKNVELMTKISEQWHKDIHELNVSNTEYQKAKGVTTQLTNEINQLKNTINEQNNEILRQSNVLEKQKEDRYTMNKQLESAFQIKDKLKFTIDSNLKSISHLQEENEKLKQELNQNISTMEELQTDYNTRELEMMNKTESLQQSIDDHLKERRIWDKSLLDMTVQNQKVNQQNEDLVSEIAELNDEIKRLKSQLALYESNSHLMSEMQEHLGYMRSQLEKLLVNITENEIELTDLKKQNFVLTQQNSERANVQHILEVKLTKLIDKFKELKIEYDLLQTNYGKLIEIKDHATQSLSESQYAIDELKDREDICNQLLAKQDEHIRTLLDDRSALRTKIDEMHRDMIILSNTLDSMDTKLHRHAPFSETVTRKTKLFKYRSVPALNTADETLHSIINLRKKIYEARHFWQNGMEEAFK